MVRSASSSMMEMLLCSEGTAREKGSVLRRVFDAVNSFVQLIYLLQLRQCCVVVSMTLFPGPHRLWTVRRTSAPCSGKSFVTWNSYRQSSCSPVTCTLLVLNSVNLVLPCHICIVNDEGHSMAHQAIHSDENTSTVTWRYSSPFRIRRDGADAASALACL